LTAGPRHPMAAPAGRRPAGWSRALAGALIAFGIGLPFFLGEASGFMNATIIALAYAVMSLGLNIVVGMAGLLDLGYVAFYALGAYSLGWLGSEFFSRLNVHVLVSPVTPTTVTWNVNNSPFRRKGAAAAMADRSTIIAAHSHLRGSAIGRRAQFDA